MRPVNGRTIGRVLLGAIGVMCAWAHPHQAPYQTMCPPASSLVKQHGLWVAPGGWRSYEDSLDQYATHFLGARWSGLNVGHVFCVYQGDEKYTFPIQLTNELLAKEPHGLHWKPQKHSQTGAMSCNSALREHCAFHPVGHPHGLTSPEQVRHLLDSIKQ